MEAGLASFGDAEAAKQMVREIGHGTPLGRILGNGAAITGRVLGVSRVPHAKGQALPAYDPRSIKGLAVTFSTSPMGADHTAGHTARFAVKQHLKEGQVENSRKAQILATCLDSLGICLFAGGAYSDHFETLIDAVNARYGLSLNLESLNRLAEETIAIERGFNIRAGLNQTHDRLPDFFYEEQNPDTGSIIDFSDQELASVWDGLMPPK